MPFDDLVKRSIWSREDRYLQADYAKVAVFDLPADLAFKAATLDRSVTPPSVDSRRIARSSCT
jgi:hypothetical protein